MSQILIVDDQPFARELIFDALRQRGYTCESAADGSIAWPMLKNRPFQLVITDMAMPVIDGLRLVREMRGDDQLRTLPVIFLTTVLERASLVEAKQLGVRDYLLKNTFSLADLVQRVERILGPATPPAANATARPGADASPAAPASAAPAKTSNVHLPRLLERDIVLEAVKEMGSLRTFASIGTEVTRLVALGEAGAAELMRTVRHDPVLSARAMQLANTKTATAATIDDAVRKIGPEAIKNLAAAPALVPANFAEGQGLLRCWQHRFAVAHLMERLVPRTDQITSSVAYATGLLHDLGEVLLRQRFADSFRAAQQFAKQADQPLPAVQQHVLGVSPADLSAATLTAIGAPPLIADAIARFWTPVRGGTIDAAETLSAALRLAIDFAAAFQFGNSAEYRIAPITQAACRAAMLAPGEINAAEIRAEATMVFAGALDNAAALSPPRNVKIGYVRHSSFSSVDPVAAAVEQLAGLRESTTLPSASQLATFDGLILVAPQLTTAGLTPPEIDHLRRQAGKPTLPVLFVVGGPVDAQPLTIPGIQALRAPVSLAEIAAFVAAC